MKIKTCDKSAKMGRTLQITEYSNLYEKIVKKDHILRKIKENIDFGFVNPMLKSSYCEIFGRQQKVEWLY